LVAIAEQVMVLGFAVMAAYVNRAGYFEVLQLDCGVNTTACSHHDPEEALPGVSAAAAVLLIASWVQSAGLL